MHTTPSPSPRSRTQPRVITHVLAILLHAASRHDHAGESVIFIVVLVADGFEGGEFMYRQAQTGEEVAVDLQLGDAVVCPSPMEHCVRPLTSGSRVSMNIDFWSVDMQQDSRSLANKY